MMTQVEEKTQRRGRKRRPSSDIGVEAKRAILSTDEFLFKSEGEALALGEGDTGQLGLGEDIMERKRPALIPKLPKNIVQVVAGGMHSVCLTSEGEVWTFGCNDEHALGRVTDDSNPEMEPGRVVLDEEHNHIVMVSAGDSHTAALTKNGKILVWGTFRDSNGVMGLTHAKEIAAKPICIPCKDKVIKIVSGSDHVAFLTDIGGIFTFGCGEQGQLGRIPPVFSSVKSRRGSDLLQPAPIRIHKKVIFSNIWAGSYATFAKCRKTSAIYAWGLNNYNQLGVAEDKNSYFPQIAEAFSGKVWAAVAVGQHHTVALDDQGCAYAIGRGDYGRLGLGNSEHVSTLMKIPDLEDVIQISCGTACSFAVTSKGEGFSWGMGSNKQLSHGDEDDAEKPTKMIGKNLAERHMTMVSAGGQHTILLVNKAADSTSTDNADSTSTNNADSK